MGADDITWPSFAQRDESIRLQLAAGAMEHERLFGVRAAGLWMPECAYRPRGIWNPDPVAPGAGTMIAPGPGVVGAALVTDRGRTVIGICQL